MAGYISGGAAIGAASGSVGGSIVQAGGFMSNTMGIMSSSMINSMGISALSGGQMAPNISFGFASFDFGSGEFGYLGKNGNSFLQNLGCTFGAMANVQDIVAGVHGTTLDVKSRNALSGHSQSNGTYTETNANGKLVTKDITISVGPEDQSIGQGTGLKWEMEYVRRSLKGAAVKGENVSYILPPSEDPLHRV